MSAITCNSCSTGCHERSVFDPLFVTSLHLLIKYIKIILRVAPSLSSLEQFFALRDRVHDILILGIVFALFLPPPPSVWQRMKRRTFKTPPLLFLRHSIPCVTPSKMPTHESSVFYLLCPWMRSNDIAHTPLKCWGGLLFKNYPFFVSRESCLSFVVPSSLLCRYVKKVEG